MSEKYPSIREVDQTHGVTYQMIWGMVRAGELPAIWVRNAIRIPESALTALPKYEPPKSGEGGQP